MRDYELIAFVNETASSAPPGKESINLITNVVRQHGGEAVKIDSLGKRLLGYPVKKQREGILVVSHCRFDPSSIGKVVNSLRLNSSVLTSMITKKKESPAKQSLLRQEVRPVKKPLRGRAKVN